MSQELFSEYFKKIAKAYRTGEARELTYRHDFQNFIENLFPNLKLSEENRIIKKIGRPDYTCFKKGGIKLGYIETKDIGVDLSKEINGEQIKKYSEGAIPNIILTDYMRFILIRKQEVIFDVDLFKPYELNKDKKIFDEKIINEFKKLLESFINYSLPTIKNSTELAIQLSKRAKLLRDLVKEQLEEDLQKVKNKEETDSAIYDFYGAFRELIRNAPVLECVDAYAQTITYGLFLSKIGSHDGLSRDSAVTYIPSSISIIKKIFMNITGDALPKNLSWIVDEIVDILNYSDINKILSEFVFEGKNYKDPFIHFYEDFLKEYDPIARKHLGVYYTPEPVVSFITRSINEILKKDFGKSTGFADDSVKVLDPATGTGTFIANSFYWALQEIRKRGLAGIEKEKIKNHLLKDFYAFEILISPYVISHLKLTLMLEQEGYRLEDKDRIQVYLTNTLDLSETISSLSGFLKELSKETLMANTIKKEKPILAIMGNPPYSVSSQNKSEWIMEKIKDYKQGLKERRLGNLDDDYIKFIKFAQWKIEQNKEGIIGFITNNSFVDGLTFRRMRESLLNSFDSVYILNLHGDSRKKEKSPDGSKDENVFDIQQGVAISLFIKKKELKNKGVFYYDLYGKRKDKYDFLYGNDYTKVNWEKLNINQPNFFFIKKDLSGKRKYDKFYPLTEIFDIYSSGVKTHKDHFLISFDQKTLSENIQEFLNKKKDEFYLRDKFNLQDTMNWKIVEARNNTFKEDNIKEFHYRPFDFRFIYYEDKIITRPLKKIMKHFFKDNIGLVTTRIGLEANNVFITKNISDIHLTGGQSYVFPLYVYNDSKKEISQKTLDGGEIKTKIGKYPNFRQNFLEFLEKQYPNQKITPEDILSYIYAVLHSENYNDKYREFLKMDFPKIPFVKDCKIFKKLSEIGDKLINLHTLKINFSKNISKFEKEGDYEVKFVKYKDNKVYINDNQYFENINKGVWEFKIGSYQVIDKWLKGRIERKLNYREVEHLIKVVNVISETINLIKEINKIKID
ncbi:MAG: type ISP restriction/modification enzyme [Nanoarchaeota archaeon]